MTSSPGARLRREAATQMREQHGVSHPRHEMWFTLADLLEADAKKDENGEGDHQIAAVARSYLAAVGRPDIDGEIG